LWKKIYHNIKIRKILIIMAENNCFFHNRMDYGFMTDYRPNSDVVSEVASPSGKKL